MQSDATISELQSNSSSWRATALALCTDVQAFQDREKELLLVTTSLQNMYSITSKSNQEVIHLISRLAKVIADGDGLLESANKVLACVNKRRLTPTIANIPPFNRDAVRGDQFTNDVPTNTVTDITIHPPPDVSNPSPTAPDATQK